VLPCGYLYNVNNPASTACRAHMGPRTPEICLRIFRKNCETHSGVGKPACDAVVSHARAECQWSSPTSPRDVRVVHFKGKQHKPWAVSRGLCRRLRDGALRMETGHRPIEALDDYAVEWSESIQACQSRGGRHAILWASGEPMKEKRCCTLFGALAAKWFEFAPKDETA
jgi:hypothetical protein